MSERLERTFPLNDPPPEDKRLKRLGALLADRSQKCGLDDLILLLTVDEDAEHWDMLDAAVEAPPTGPVLHSNPQINALMILESFKPGGHFYAEFGSIQFSWTWGDIVGKITVEDALALRRGWIQLDDNSPSRNLII